MDIKRIKKDAEQRIEEKGEDLLGLARYLWEIPEYNFNEFGSQSHGFYSGGSAVHT